MSRTIQSSNYVPGVSGWKFNSVTGEFEIHSSDASTSAEPRLISVIAGSWSDYDLPSNALERHAFIGAELEKIPADCRDSAEFTTEDISFDRDGSDVRTTLTYERRETCEEVADRIEKSSVSSQMSGLVGGGFNIFHNGQLRVRLGSLEGPSPFVVADGKVYLRDDLVKEGSITSAKIGDEWSVRFELSPTGQTYAAGFGIGICTAGDLKPDIIVKASHMEILPDGLVKITQAPKKS
ncbi:phage tail tip fiber protein [Pseudomonas antarctica]|uniref:phage tail tip fiber protein n=1 Tax=Pseudomonas antarctica TaxID=219572 RepID=UPI00387AF5A9